jgi:GT2 family glycosyltransferase
MACINRNTIPNIGLIILNWNNFDDSNTCITSAKDIEYDAYDIILVDNGSTDNSIARLKREHPDITTIELPENLGYASGMNRGIAYCLQHDYDYIMLSNNDVVFDDRSILTELTGCFSRYPKLGALSPSTRQIGISFFAIEYLSGLRVGVSKPDFDLLSNRDLRWPVNYACVMFSNECIRDIGVLPEHYFMYCEDLAHISKLESRGYWGAEYVHTKINHGISNSSDDRGELVAYYITRNKFLLYRDVYDSVFLFFIPYILYFSLSRAIFNLIRGNKSKSEAFILGLLDGLRMIRGKHRYP